MSDQGFTLPSPVENFNLVGGSDPNAQGQGGSSEQGSNGFLNSVDPADRPVVEKYFKNWDAATQRRYQEIHETYRPYKDLGLDYQTMVQAVQVYNLLKNDPDTVYNSLKEVYDQQAQQTQQQQQLAEQYNIPPQMMEEFNQMKQVIGQMGQQFLGSQQAQQAQAEDAQLDTYMDWLHQSFGEFDDVYVLSRMHAGMDGPEAVKAYSELVNSISSSPIRPVVRPLSGGGAVGSNTFDPRKAPANEIKNFVAQAMAAASLNDKG